MAVGDKRPVLMAADKGMPNGVSGLDENKQAIYAINKNLGVVPIADLLEWASMQMNAGSFTVDPRVTSAGLPENGVWLFGLLEIMSGGRRMTVTTSTGSITATYVNVTAGGGWGTWMRLGGSEIMEITGEIPVPTCEANYFVRTDHSSFPYPYGRLEIRYGSSTGEYVATFKSTGDDKKMYYSVWRVNEWSPWTS